MDDFSTIINTERVKEIPLVFQRQKETFKKLAEEAKELEIELDKKDRDLAEAKLKLEEVSYYISLQYHITVLGTVSSKGT